MKIARLVAGLAGVLIMVPGVLARQDGHDHAAPPASPVQPPSGVAPNPGEVKFETMVRHDSDGKIVRFEGVVDIMALHRNPTIDAATWDKMSPHIKDWVGDMDRAVIDNLDFVEKIDGGMLSDLNLMDMNNNRMVMEMMMQFLAIGPLTGYLESKNAISRFQSQVNTNIVNDYLQPILNEVREDSLAKARAAGNNQAAIDEATAKATSKFIFELMCRDGMESYRRMLDAAAPNMNNLVAALKPDEKTLAAVRPALGSIGAAEAGAERRKVVKSVLAALSFDQRREVLRKAREMAPAFDPKTAYKDVVPPMSAGDKSR